MGRRRTRRCLVKAWKPGISLLGVGRWEAVAFWGTSKTMRGLDFMEFELSGKERLKQYKPPKATASNYPLPTALWFVSDTP